MKNHAQHREQNMVMFGNTSNSETLLFYIKWIDYEIKTWWSCSMRAHAWTSNSEWMIESYCAYIPHALGVGIICAL